MTVVLFLFYFQTLTNTIVGELAVQFDKWFINNKVFFPEIINNFIDHYDWIDDLANFEFA